MYIKKVNLKYKIKSGLGKFSSIIKEKLLMNLTYALRLIKKSHNKRNIIQLTYCPTSHGEKTITIEREIATSKTPKSIRSTKYTLSPNTSRRSVNQSSTSISKKQLKF